MNTSRIKPGQALDIDRRPEFYQQRRELEAKHAVLGNLRETGPYDATPTIGAAILCFAVFSVCAAIVAFWGMTHPIIAKFVAALERIESWL